MILIQSALSGVRLIPLGYLLGKMRFISRGSETHQEDGPVSWIVSSSLGLGEGDISHIRVGIRLFQKRKLY